MIKVHIFPYFLKILLEWKQKGQKTILCWLHVQSSQPTFQFLYRAARKKSYSLNRFGLSYLFCLKKKKKVIICSFIKFTNFSKISELKFWVHCPIFVFFLYDLLSVAHVSKSPDNLFQVWKMSVFLSCLWILPNYSKPNNTCHCYYVIMYTHIIYLSVREEKTFGSTVYTSEL